MSNEARSEVTTYDDGKFVRTAIVVLDDGTSFDLVDMKGTRVAEINAFVYSEENDSEEVSHLIVDVIDKDELFGDNQALTFDNGKRNFHDAGRVVSTDFRKAS